MKGLMIGIQQRPDLVMWYLAWLILIVVQGVTLH